MISQAYSEAGFSAERICREKCLPMQLSCQLWISMLSTQRGMTLRYYGYSAIQMLARANCRNSQQHGNWKFCSFPAHFDTVHTADPYTYTFTYSKPKINWVKINNFEVFFFICPE